METKEFGIEEGKDIGEVVDGQKGGIVVVVVILQDIAVVVIVFHDDDMNHTAAMATVCSFCDFCCRFPCCELVLLFFGFFGARSKTQDFNLSRFPNLSADGIWR